jgi:hypothetical protein
MSTRFASGQSARFWPALLLLLTVAPGVALADADDAQREAAARVIFEQAAQLMDQKKFAEACPKVEEALKLAPKAVGARLTLASCYESLGKLASAWATYAQAEAAARAAGQEERAQGAKDSKDRLKPRLSSLTITVAPALSGVAGLDVKRDGVPVSSAQWGTALPVDPGEHVVVSSVPGIAPWSTKVEVLGEGNNVVLEVKAPSAAPPSTAPPPPDAPAASPAQRSFRGPIGAVVAGVGVAALGAGVVMGLVAKSRYSGAVSDGHCSAEHVCDQTGFDTQTGARALGTAGTVVFVIGAAAAVGGGVLWLTAPARTPAPEKSAGSLVRIGVSPGSVIVGGAW